MTCSTPRRTYAISLSLVALLAACGDAALPPAPALAPDDVRLASATVSATESATGKGIGTIASAVDRTRARIRYHGGPVMLGTVHVYHIYYGNWDEAVTRNILAEFNVGLGGSPYYAINTTYHDGEGRAVSNFLVYGGSADHPADRFRGHQLTEADVGQIVFDMIATGLLPLGTNSIYVVLGAKDVTVSSSPTAGFCTSYCGFHGVVNVAGSDLKYAFIGHTSRCPEKCAAQLVGPNGTLAGDAMANVMANLVSTTVTDPFLSAWYDRLGLENADKCAWNFGPTYTAPNGARANIQLGNRHFLLQQNWVNASRGYCAMSLPPAGASALEGEGGEGPVAEP